MPKILGLCFCKEVLHNGGWGSTPEGLNRSWTNNVPLFCGLSVAGRSCSNLHFSKYMTSGNHILHRAYSRDRQHQNPN